MSPEDSSSNPGPGPSGREAVTGVLERHRFLLLASVGTLLYVTGLGWRDLWFPNEPNVADAAQAMFLSGDWVVPRRMGEVWVDYPPLLYWAGAASSAVFGEMSAFSLRLPSALGAIALSLVTCFVGSRRFGPSTGLWAGFLLLTFPQFALQAVGYRPDMLFSLFIAAGLFTYAAGVDSEPSRKLRIAGFALLGLAMLTKGPLGLLLPGLVLVLWHGTRREWRRLAALAPLGLVSLAIYLAWFVACAHQTGAGGVVEELWQQHFARFGSGVRGHARPPYYYAVNLWIDLAPWSLLLPLALWRIRRCGAWRDPGQQLLLWWFGAFFVFLSLAVTKRQLYLLPAYPAAALLMGQWIAVRGRDVLDTLERRLSGAFVTVVAAALALAGGILLAASLGSGLLAPVLALEPLHELVFLSLRGPGLATGALSVAAGLWVLRVRRYPDLPRALLRIAVVTVPLYFLAFGWFMPKFDPVKSYEPVGRWIRQKLGSEKVFGAAVSPRERAKMAAFTYHTRRKVEFLATEDAVARFLEDHPGSVVLLARSAVETIYGAGRTDWQERVVKEAAAGGHHYFLLRG